MALHLGNRGVWLKKSDFFLCGSTAFTWPQINKMAVSAGSWLEDAPSIVYRSLGCEGCGTSLSDWERHSPQWRKRILGAWLAGLLWGELPSLRIWNWLESKTVHQTRCLSLKYLGRSRKCQWRSRASGNWRICRRVPKSLTRSKYHSFHLIKVRAQSVRQSQVQAIILLYPVWESERSFDKSYCQ